MRYSPWWLFNVILLVVRNLIQILLEIRLSGVDPFSLVDELPNEVHNWEYANHGVAEQEGRNIPKTRKENRVATNERHDEAQDEGVPCTVWLPERFVWKRVAADTLCCERFPELEVGEAHDTEVDQLRCSDLLKLDYNSNSRARDTYQIDKPLEDDGGIVADLQEC